MLPGEDGVSLCKRLRAHSILPVIMLTARGEEADRITGLEAGADDYLAKPFNPRELLARVHSVLRRARTLPEDVTPDQARALHVSPVGSWIPLTRQLLSPAGRGHAPVWCRIPVAAACSCTMPAQVLSRDRLTEIDPRPRQPHALRPQHRRAGEPPAAAPGRRRPGTRLHPHGARRGLRVCGAGGGGGVMRLWPRSLFGRLVLVLLSGLIVAQLISAAISLSERDQALFTSAMPSGRSGWPRR